MSGIPNNGSLIALIAHESSVINSSLICGHVRKFLGKLRILRMTFRQICTSVRVRSVRSSGGHTCILSASSQPTSRSVGRST